QRDPLGSVCTNVRQVAQIRNTLQLPGGCGQAQGTSFRTAANTLPRTVPPHINFRQTELGHSETHYSKRSTNLDTYASPEGLALTLAQNHRRVPAGANAVGD